MSVIIAIFCVFGTAASIVFLSTLDLGNWLTAALIAPLVLLAVYSMARIQPGEKATKTETAVQGAAEPFEA